MANVLIFNAYSAANRGDGLIVSRMAQAFAARGHEVRVMSDDPADRGRYPGERVAPPLDAWKAYGALPKARLALRAGVALASPSRLGRPFRWADVCVSAGGGYLYDDGGRAARMNLALRLLGIRLATSAGAPVVLFSQSVGPFRSARWARLAGRALGDVDLVIARDDASAETARALGARRVEVCDDIAFAASEDDPSGAAAPDGSGRPPLVGVTVLDALPGRGPEAVTRYQDLLARALVAALRGGGAQVRVISQVAAHDRDTDERAGRRLAQRLADAGVEASFTRLDGIADDEILAWYRRLDLMVASRLHSAILALSAGVPAIGLGYLPKTAAMYERLGLAPLAHEIDELSEEGLAETLRATRAELPAWRGRVRAAVRDARASALRAVDLTLAEIGGAG